MAYSKKIVVAIITSYSSKQPAGLERFLIDVLRSLHTYQDESIQYVIYTHKGSDIQQILQKEGITSIDVVFVSGGILWKHVGLWFAPKADIYLWNGTNTSWLFFPKKSVVLIYDFAYKYFGVLSIQRYIKNKFLDVATYIALRFTNKIISISDATTNDAIKYFSIRKEKFITIYPGFTAFSNKAAISVPQVEGNPYFMFIGTLKERKNVLRVIEAYIAWRKKTTHTHRLCIIGKTSDMSSYVQHIRAVATHSDFSSDILFLGHISDEQVQYMYTHATAVVFPSLLEGFGFPVVEAMSLGAPLITSSTTSLGEIAGDAALLVDPTSVDELVHAYEAMTYEQTRQQYIQKGYERYPYFSWQKTANELHRVFLSIFKS